MKYTLKKAPVMEQKTFIIESNLYKKLYKLLLSMNFLCSLICTASLPYINKRVLSQVPDYWLSVETIVVCLLGIVYSTVNKKSKFFYKNIVLLNLVESLITLSTLIITLSVNNVIVWYVMSVLCFTIFTKNVVSLFKVFNNKLVNTTERRTAYDMDKDIVCSIATVIGGILGIFTSKYCSLEVLMIICTVAYLVDNIGYGILIKIYYKEKEAWRKKNGY